MVVSEDLFSLKEFKLKHNEQKARKIMRSYARNVSIAASDETIRDDCIISEDSFDKDTFAKYINVMENLYVIEELPAS